MGSPATDAAAIAEVAREVEFRLRRLREEAEAIASLAAHLLAAANVSRRYALTPEELEKRRAQLAEARSLRQNLGRRPLFTADRAILYRQLIATTGDLDAIRRALNALDGPRIANNRALRRAAINAGIRPGQAEALRQAQAPAPALAR